MGKQLFHATRHKEFIDKDVNDSIFGIAHKFRMIDAWQTQRGLPLSHTRIRVTSYLDARSWLFPTVSIWFLGVKCLKGEGVIFLRDLNALLGCVRPRRLCFKLLPPSWSNSVTKMMAPVSRVTIYPKARVGVSKVVGK